MLALLFMQTTKEVLEDSKTKISESEAKNAPSSFMLRLIVWLFILSIALLYDSYRYKSKHFLRFGLLLMSFQFSEELFHQNPVSIIHNIAQHMKGVLISDVRIDLVDHWTFGGNFCSRSPTEWTL
jgi:hypothetical protein